MINYEGILSKYVLSQQRSLHIIDDYLSRIVN